MSPTRSALRAARRARHLLRDRRGPLAPVATALLVVLGLLAVAPARVAADEPAPRTWVVDAVDDADGSRWESVDTGGNTITIRPGDTVEWRFDAAAMEHDLTSEDVRSPWSEPVREYRVPGDPPVRRTFTEPGTYHYVCSLHGTVMWGVVVVEEAANALPTGTATASPDHGPAPLEVELTADVTDPDGDPLTHHWDFGDGDPEAPGGSAWTPHAVHTYTAPGTYTAVLTVDDGNGGVFRQELVVTVGADPGGLPDVHAHADHAPGATAPLPVAFTTEVGTAGSFTAYADGVDTFPDLSGTARLVRSRGRTLAALDVTGLAPEAAHQVHVHEQPCTSATRGGAHFRFDEGRPFAEENEVWLPFTSDASGASGEVVVAQPVRAGAKAVSIVIHDPVNPALRIGCADLVPSTADLDYAWDFGDGHTGTGPDPNHTYTSPGTRTATVTVTAPGGESTAASVDVVVLPDTVAPRTTLRGGPTGTVRARNARFRLSSDEPGRFRCRLDAGRWRDCAATPTFGGLRDGPHVLRVRAVDRAGNVDPSPAVRRWRVDTRGPAVARLRPVGGTRDRTPLVRARVVDRWSAVRARSVVLRVDGRRVAGRYDARRDVVRWQARKALPPGRHRVRLVVRDALGNATVRTWTFRVRR
ncbi:FOG: PKD repeat [Nocardioides sp. J9]|uniref:PKD domain-containing protein n=1 Tax=Nocardioides sp. J9 TaxID=935844 RepID=UPI0011A23D75|nr:PKD domain-containing protein [Nocardioides sp. J9]TWH04710.1 FOG: PKD repeat [Nocardioides sp. J9]